MTDLGLLKRAKYMIKSMLIAGAGGFLGTCGRYLVSRLTAGWTISPFPIGTFLVNMIGCLLIGLLFGLAQRSNILSQHLNTLLITGFCGGFTTFSTFSNEMHIITQSRHWMCAACYLSLSVILGILMVWLGRNIAH